MLQLAYSEGVERNPDFFTLHEQHPSKMFFFSFSILCMGIAILKEKKTTNFCLVNARKHIRFVCACRFPFPELDEVRAQLKETRREKI